MRLVMPMLTVACLFGLDSARAQGRGIIPVHSSFERVAAIVPIIGAGTVSDPTRPMFVPAGGFQQNVRPVIDRTPASRTGIISYSYQMSDDGKSALVEFVSVDRAGLREILESKAAGVTVFERGKHDKATIEAAFKGKKKDFDFEKFSMNKVR